MRVDEVEVGLGGGGCLGFGFWGLRLIKEFEKE